MGELVGWDLQLSRCNVASCGCLQAWQQCGQEKLHDVFADVDAYEHTSTASEEHNAAVLRKGILLS